MSRFPKPGIVTFSSKPAIDANGSLPSKSDTGPVKLLKNTATSEFWELIGSSDTPLNAKSWELIAIPIFLWFVGITLTKDPETARTPIFVKPEAIVGRCCVAENIPVVPLRAVEIALTAGKTAAPLAFVWAWTDILFVAKLVKATPWAKLFALIATALLLADAKTKPETAIPVAPLSARPSIPAPVVFELVRPIKAEPLPCPKAIAPLLKPDITSPELVSGFCPIPTVPLGPDTLTRCVLSVLITKSSSSIVPKKLVFTSVPVLPVNLQSFDGAGVKADHNVPSQK